MDNQAYLDQITASSQPVSAKPKRDFPLSPLAIKLLASGIILTILIIIIGSLLGGVSGKSKSLAEQLSIRMTNLIATNDNYVTHIKSSSLRSAGVSLSGALTNTNRELTTYMTEQYDYNASKPNASLTESETALNDALNTTLENARLNGLLDRTYAREMALQVALLLSLESDLAARDNNTTLQTILANSTSSLETISVSFSNYSEKSK